MSNKDPLDYNTTITPILKELAAPLYQLFSITTFSYLKFLKNGQMMHISSHNKWLDHYMVNYLYDDSDRYTREIGIVQKKEKNFFLRIPTKNHCFEKIMNDFGLCYGISIYQECEDYIEMFGFATDINNPAIIETYINNIEYLKRFSVFFKDKGKELISLIDKNKLITPRRPAKWISLQTLLSREKKREFLDATEVHHFPISPIAFLSLREAQTVYYKLKGDSAKEIAKKMKISYRTVETYIEKAKIKGGDLLSGSILPKNLSEKNYLDNIRVYFDCEDI